jgi:fibronectin type 3 domain-containing protein
MKHAAIVGFLIALSACGGTTGSRSTSPDVTTAAQHAVTLNWTASTTPNVTYNVYRGTQTLGPYSQIAQRVSNTIYEDGIATPGVLYFYVVTAVDSANQESEYSNEATALIPQ